MEKAIFMHGFLILDNHKSKPLNKSLLIFDKVVTDSYPEFYGELIANKHAIHPAGVEEGQNYMFYNLLKRKGIIESPADGFRRSDQSRYDEITLTGTKGGKSYFNTLQQYYEGQYDLSYWSPPADFIKKDGETKRGRLLSFLMQKLPVLSTDVDVEHLMDFKSDPDSKLKLAALRDWMVEISKKDYTQNEIEDKFEYLYMQYIDHMDRAKLKYDLGAGEFWISAVPEILDDLTHFKLGSTAKALFKVMKKDIHIREEERKAPGKELAFVYKANSEFRK